MTQAQKAGSPDDWRSELHRVIEFRDTTEDPELKKMLGELVDELITALGDPESNINKEVG